MAGKRLSQTVSVGQINAESTKSFEEFGVVRVKHVAGVHLLRIRSPLQEQVKQIPASGAKGQVQGTVILHPDVVAVAEEEKDQRLVLLRKRHLERGGHAPPLHFRALRHLKRPTLLDPALDAPTAIEPLPTVGRAKAERAAKRQRKLC